MSNAAINAGLTIGYSHMSHGLMWQQASKRSRLLRLGFDTPSTRQIVSLSLDDFLPHFIFLEKDIQSMNERSSHNTMTIRVPVLQRLRAIMYQLSHIQHEGGPVSFWKANMDECVILQIWINDVSRLRERQYCFVYLMWCLLTEG